MSSKDLNNQSSEEQNLFLNKAKDKEIQDNPWASEIKRNQDLWSKYDTKVDTTLPLPEFKLGFRLEFVPEGRADNGWEYFYNLQFNFKELLSSNYRYKPSAYGQYQQSRPQGNYWFAWNPTREPDTNHLGKSYPDFYKDGNHYMIPKEGIICALTYRLEIGRMLDIESCTLFHATDAGGWVMYMYGNANGYFRIKSLSFHSWFDKGGPRQVFLAKI